MKRRVERFGWTVWFMPEASTRRALRSSGTTLMIHPKSSYRDGEMTAAPKFVGRAREVAALDEALETVEAGRPQVVEVVGAAGIGKSRLLAEVPRRADARGHVVLEGAGAELEQDLPFWVFVDALDEY